MKKKELDEIYRNVGDSGLYLDILFIINLRKKEDRLFAFQDFLRFNLGDEYEGGK